MGIKAQWVKPWTITTKDSDFSNELQNILDEQFNPERPNTVWCSDITYIWTIDGFVYLISIMDLYSRKIIAWMLSDTLEVCLLVIPAFFIAGSMVDRESFKYCVEFFKNHMKK